MNQCSEGHSLIYFEDNFCLFCETMLELKTAIIDLSKEISNSSIEADKILEQINKRNK